MVAILERAGQLDQQITSSEVIREVAQRGGVQNVLLGSFMKVGETIRITIRLQDADSGSILASEMAEGEGESSIFPLVNDLTNRIKNTFEIPQAAEMELNRDIEDVTTASLEAYRQYAEGIRLKDEGQEREAIPWLERAVEIDPNFAMAYAKLSVIHGNNSRLTESEDYAQKALDHADRLPARERYYIEGLYYSKASGSAPRAIEAYLRLLEFYPDHTAARHNLGLQYQQLNRLDEAIEQYERALVNRCGKTSGGFLLRDLVDRDSIDIFGALVDVFHQLRCLQPEESLLRHQQHLPDHRLGVFHFLESLGRVRSQPKSGKR